MITPEQKQRLTAYDSQIKTAREKGKTELADILLKYKVEYINDVVAQTATIAELLDLQPINPREEDDYEIDNRRN